MTAIGESAGAYLIGALLNSGRQLFQKAIMESGTHILKVRGLNKTCTMTDNFATVPADQARI